MVVLVLVVVVVVVKDMRHVAGSQSKGLYGACPFSFMDKVFLDTVAASNNSSDTSTVLAVVLIANQFLIYHPNPPAAIAACLAYRD